MITLKELKDYATKKKLKIEIEYPHSYVGKWNRDEHIDRYNSKASSFTDFYIKFPGHPKFNDAEIIQDEIIKVIIQKIEMILFTNRGELLGDPNFGGDLLRYLHRKFR
jgi:hypothetical protein